MPCSHRAAGSAALVAERDHREVGAVGVAEHREAARGDVHRPEAELPPSSFAFSTVASQSETAK